MSLDPMRHVIVIAVLCFAAAPVRADDTPTFVTDPVSHCSVGTFFPEAGLVAHWSGACVGGKADGPGIVEWQTNGKFIHRHLRHDPHEMRLQ